MPHFRDDEARAIIRKTYREVRSEEITVAFAFYTADEIRTLPIEAVAMSLGVGHPVRHAHLRPGEVVLDLGCGAGIDTLLAACAVGPEGRAIGLDMTPEMATRARCNADAAGLANVDIREGTIEDIPLPDASIDVVISNGVLNLSTRKSRALAEIFRVLRPGGRVSLADLVLDEALPEEVLKSPAALAG
jgi:ubiquinone/menaquinone biosynthesis C-methylase UbiE